MGRHVLLALAALAAVMVSGVGRAGSQTPPGDHYFCYRAALAPGQPRFITGPTTLEDQFGTVLFDVRRITITERDHPEPPLHFISLCNPAQKNAEPPPTYPTVHQVGYQIQPAKTPPQPPFAKSDHVGIDQFGTHPLTLLKPVGLLVPSAKVLGSGGTGTVDTTGVDHFECYKVAPVNGAPAFVRPPPTVVTDEFGTATYSLGRITKLCTPANKDGADPSAPSHPGHLVCYRARLAAGLFAPQMVSTNDTDFGPHVLVARAVAELCVPAFKDTVPPTTTTTIPCRQLPGSSGGMCGGSCPPSPTPTACLWVAANNSCSCAPTSQECGASPTACSGLCPSPDQVCGTDSTTPCGCITMTTTTTSTTTTTFPACPQVNAPCGSCSTGGQCMLLCSQNCAQACVTQAPAPPVTACASDADCPTGQICATPGGACPGHCSVGAGAMCFSPCP